MGLEGGCCDDIATIIFLTVLSLFVVTFSTVFDMVVDERVMLEASFSSLLMVGWRVPLTPSRHSLIVVEISETKEMSDKSVSRMEMEQMDSSSVLGIFLGFHDVK